MESIYPFLIAFILVFLSELGDKTQLLVVSFCSNVKAKTILLGVALGSLFSHGIAIIFGSSISLLENEWFHFLLEFITYISFILMGLFSLIPPKEKLTLESNKKDGIVKSISKLKINYCAIIALSIIVGELGDKTFLASIGLGVRYPSAKLFLIFGAVLGMVISNLFAIIFGKILTSHVSENTMKKISGILFLIFGIVGFLM